MKDILQQRLWQHDKGLLLLDMPTGSGKTFDVIDWIAENIHKLKKENRKILFITHLKKNLPIKDFQERLVTHHKNDALFEENCLVVQSKLDAFLTYFNEYKAQIEFCFPEFDTKSLHTLLELYKINKVSDLYLQDAISRLRNLILISLNSLPDKKAKYDFLTQKEWQWVVKLFPTTLTTEKTVLFMTVKKLVYPYDTLLEPPQSFPQLLKDYQTILFIDEFDSAKKDMLDAMIDLEIEHISEYIPLVHRIASRLKESKFPTILIPEKQILTKQPPSSEIEKNLAEQSAEIDNEYDLMLSIKSKKSSTGFKPFIFQDKSSHFLVDARLNILTLKPEYAKNTLWIEEAQKNKEKVHKRLSQLLFSAQRFLHYFEIGIGMLAQEYLAHRNKNAENRKITLEDAIRSFLDFFEFDREIVRKLMNNILYRYQHKILNRSLNASESNPSNKEIEMPMSVNFYENGFSFHTISDAEEHAGRSKVQTFRFSQTPEQLLLNLANHFMVVGISATANLRTCLGNFDLYYLENQLKSYYYHLNSAEQQNLDNRFQQQIKYYDKINIQAEIIKSQSDSETSIKDNLISLFSDPDVVEQFIASIHEYHYGESFLYQLNQYYKIFASYQYFLEHNIDAFLAFFNRKYTGKELEIIIDFCKILEEKHRLLEPVEISVIYGSESEQQLKDIKESLSNGKRHFVFSTYRTLGAGINIQYPISEKTNKALIKINQRKANNYIDFDGIYLDKPTHILTNLNQELTLKNLVMFIYQLEYLNISRTGISKETFENYLEKAFQKYAYNNPVYLRLINLYSYPEYKLYVMQYILQAIGRICRSNMKCPNIHLLIDEGLIASWSDELSHIPLLPEFKAVQQAVWQYQQQELDEIMLSGRAKDYIYHLYSQFTHQTVTKLHQKLWQQLREICLKYPQYKDHSEHYFDFLYLELDNAAERYYFQMEDDYQITKLVKKGKERKEVSHRAARLDKLMQCQLLKEHFIQQGYPTQLTSSKVWLSPIIFNNIYKGALGEECGKVLWASYRLPQLSELPLHYYEFFDFQISPQIFVDFKHWSEVKLDGEEIREQIFHKMAQIGAKLVFIINIFAEKEYYPFTSYQHPKLPLSIVEIPKFFSSTQTDMFNVIEYIRQKIMEIENENE